MSGYTDKQKADFEAIARQMIEWLNVNCHPHVTVVIDTTSTELSEGVIALSTNDYLRN